MRTAPVAVVLALLLCPVDGLAQEATLDKLLQTMRDNGSLTAEQYDSLKAALNEERHRAGGSSEEEIEEAVREAMAKMEKGGPAGVTAGYDKGFYIKSGDDKFRLRVGGRLQSRFTYLDIDDARDTSSFSIRRARLVFEGHVFDPQVKYKVQAEAAGSSMRLLDAYIDAAPIGDYAKELRLRAGQFKSPQGRQFLTSSQDLALQERSLAILEFVPDRQVGAMLHGECGEGGWIEWQSGIFNGEGQNVNANDNNAVMSVSRVVLNILGQDRRKVEYDESDPLVYGGNEDDERESPFRAFIGASYQYNPDRVLVVGIPPAPDRFETVRTNQVGLEAGARCHGFSLFGEYFTRHVSSTQDNVKNRDDAGWYAQFGYLLTKHLELAGRYSEMNLAGTENDRQNETALGLNYYFHGHRLKLQTEYVYSRDDVGGKVTDANIVRTQLQLVF